MHTSMHGYVHTTGMHIQILNEITKIGLFTRI